MSGRGISSGHVLPPNPTWIDFPVSDGNVGLWPTNTTRVVDQEGHVNYMRPVPIDESLSIKWRREVGASLALQLKKPEGPSYVLRSWPAGYQMFDHNKGPAGSPRHDAYLIGSRTAKRFRSVPEFIPHALWLLTDPTLNRANCNCKYCNKKPQREITASMGLLPRRSTPLSAPPTRPTTMKPGGPVTASSSASAMTRTTRERSKPYAALRRIPRPVKQSQGPKQNMLRDRNADLRSAYAEGIHLRKWYREGELLWCALNPPIPGLTGEKDAITFWPGIVEEARMKAKVTKHPSFGAQPAVEVDEDQGAQPGEGSGATPNGDAPADGEQVPWTVVQMLSYKMKLLGILYSYYIPADQVLPYQAHAPSDELIQAIHHVPLEQMNTDTDSFRPTDKTTFVEAAAPYALAVQIAANLAGFWSPTDEWEYKFSLTPLIAPPPPPMQSRIKNGPPSGLSLDSVMNASMSFNASLASAISGAGYNNPFSSSAAPSPLALTQTVAQTRYQGLWWGAERIWTDELVRLKLSRAQIAPKGAENILSPSGPSRRSLEYATSLGKGENDDGPDGAATRGVFMRIDGLFVADVTRPDGTLGKECRAVGMLYELADEDWEGDVGGSGNGDESGKGKGKAIEGPAPVMNGTSSQAAGSSTNGQADAPVDGASSTTPPLDTTAKQKERSANEQLSHPVLSSPFPLPLPPEGYKFRPILTPGHEAILSLNLIAGRYYPRLLRHPLLHPFVERALDLVGGEVIENGQLWALEGLVPGYYNTMDPVRWRPSRIMMVREADLEARDGLSKHWQARARERDEKRALESGYLPPQELPSSMMMDVDGVGTSASHAPAGVQQHSD